MSYAVVVSGIALGCYLILVAITVRHNFRRRTNQAFVLYLAAMVFWQFTALLVSLSRDAESALFWYRLMTAGMLGQFIFYCFFILAFRGLERSRPLHFAGWAIFFLALALSGTDLIIRGVHQNGTTDLHVPEFGSLVPAVGLAAYAFLMIGVYRVVQGYFGTRSHIQRNRFKYLLIGSGVIAVGSVSNLVPGLQALALDVVANVVNAALIAYAILRYQLLDITLVVRRGLLYSIPTLIIGAAYFLLISLALEVFHHVAGPQLFLVSLCVALLTAAVAQPLRNRAQSFIDKMFFREKYDSSLMLQRLSSAAASTLDLGRLTSMILDEVTSTMHIQRAVLFLRQADTGEFWSKASVGLDLAGRPRLRQGHPILSWLSSHDKVLTGQDMDVKTRFKGLWEDEWEDLDKIGAELYVPLKARGELVGTLAVGPKLSEQMYSQDEQLTLRTLANQTAVAIANAQLYWDLEEALIALREAHDELEGRVQERTAELATANYALQVEIGERMRAEQQLQHHAAELEQSNRELEQFAYVASHDLQEPLRMVTSYVQLLERRYKNRLDADADDFIDFVVEGASRMQQLIKGLLAYSRVGTQGRPFEPVDCQLVMNHVLENLRFAIEDSEAAVSHDPLPTVTADPTQLLQLFQNLISNAIKFQGAKPPRIHIGARWQDNGASKNGAKWLFSVADDGIGLEPKYSERIFMIFQRLHTRDKYPGTGIGLSICKRIVERHGGSIWVESQLGEGATFFFTLPDGAIASPPQPSAGQKDVVMPLLEVS
jgi:signal transduction histidine kinase